MTPTEQGAAGGEAVQGGGAMQIGIDYKPQG